MFDAQSLTVPVGQEVQNSKEVENTSKNSRKAKIDSFVAKLEKDLSLQDSIRGRKYNYLFNDFGLPTIENQPIFVQLYKHSLKLFKDYPLSEDIWENICEDAVEKGVDILESDKYRLGKDFYTYLYNEAMEDCVKIYEQETLNKVPESERKVRMLGNNIYYYTDALKFDELLTSIRNKLSDIATRQLLIDEIKLANFNTDSKPVEPVIQLIDDIKKPFEKKVEPTENTNKTIQDKFKELDETPDEPEKPVDEPVKKSEIPAEELSKSNMQKSVILDFLSSILKNKDKAKETQEPKQPELVEDIDNKDETLENEDKQIDDDLSSEENKDINTETDNNNIESLSDTDTEEKDMNSKEKDSNVRFSAFGVDLTFEVPDFVIVSKTLKLVDEYLNKNQYIPSSDRYAFRNIILLPDLRKRNIIGMLNDENDKEQNYWGRPLELIVCWMMKNSLYGLSPKLTEEDVLNKISDRLWVQEIRKKNIGLNSLIFDTKTYTK